MKLFAALLSFAFLAASASAELTLGYDNHLDGGFAKFPANTNVAAMSTNNAGAAWRNTAAYWVHVPQASIFAISGKVRTTTALASNQVYRFSGSWNGVDWTTNAYTVTVSMLSFTTNRFTVSVATNLPYLYLIWDGVDNRDTTVAVTNDFLRYMFLPYNPIP